jgi:hypothetical protein
VRLEEAPTKGEELYADEKDGDEKDGDDESNQSD